MISGAQLRGYDHKNNAIGAPRLSATPSQERRSVVLRPKNDRDQPSAFLIFEFTIAPMMRHQRGQLTHRVDILAGDVGDHRGA
jgi:hypothetical protein